MNKHTKDLECPLCEEKLKSVHPFLVSWFTYHIKPRWPNAHISCGHRGKFEQEFLWIDKKTQLHWPNSKHNKFPAEAIDLFQIDRDGKAYWDVPFFTDLVRYSKENDIQLIWGGNFANLRDYCHFEME